MRVLHSAALLSPASGITNQMAWEQAAGEKLRIVWHSRMFCPYGTLGAESIKVEATTTSTHWPRKIDKLKAWLSLRKEYHEWLRSQYDNYDVFILRYYPHDPFQAQFVWQCDKPVFYMHHSLELPELAMPGNSVSVIRTLSERMIGRLAGRVASGLVGVTKEIVDYELGRFRTPHLVSYVYPNGVQYEPQFSVRDRRTDVPEFLFVSGFFFSWHGLDRLIDASLLSPEPYVIHIVGEVSEADKKRAASDPRFIFHGSLSNAEIARLSEQCWLGFSSFAVDRKQMRQACSLKTREYLMLGLPVYAGYEEVFDKSFPYFRQGPLSMTAILDYAATCRDNDKAMVSMQAKPLIEKQALLKNLYLFLEEHYLGATVLHQKLV